MKAIFCTGAMMMALAGTALAQSASETTVTQSTTAPVYAPPPGTLSTTRTTRAVDAYGNQFNQRQTTYRNTQGVASDSRTTTTIVPAQPPVTTTTTTTNSSTTVPQ